MNWGRYVMVMNIFRDKWETRGWTNFYSGHSILLEFSFVSGQKSIYLNQISKKAEIYDNSTFFLL